MDTGVYLGISLARIADRELESGDVRAARAALTAARAVIEAGLAIDEGKPVLPLVHARVLTRLGEMQTAVGEHAEAAAMFRQARSTLLAQSVRSGPANVHERRHLVLCELAAAALAAAEGDHEAALAGARAAEALARAIADADPWLHEAHALAARSLLPQAHAQWALQRGSEALATAMRAQERFAALVAHAVDDVDCRCELARACLLAAEVRSALATTGDSMAAVEARATAAAERARARELLQALLDKDRLPAIARPLLAAATAR